MPDAKGNINQIDNGNCKGLLERNITDWFNVTEEKNKFETVEENDDQSGNLFMILEETNQQRDLVSQEEKALDRSTYPRPTINSKYYQKRFTTTKYRRDEQATEEEVTDLPSLWEEPMKELRALSLKSVMNGGKLSTKKM